jgi:hypothetical protein
MKTNNFPRSALKLSGRFHGVLFTQGRFAPIALFWEYRVVSGTAMLRPE